MKSSSYNVLKKILEENNKNDLIKYLSENEKKQLNITKVSKDKTIKDFLDDNLLDHVHYSWLIPSLKAYSKTDMPFFLESIGSEKSKKLSKMINIKNNNHNISNIAKCFFIDILKAGLVGEKNLLLPPTFLPDSDLNFLINFSKEDLVLIIDFLGLYDLAKEIPHIVDKNLLLKIQKLLDNRKKEFLKIILSKKEQLSIPRINWDKNTKTLMILLHKRGLLRFSKAFSFQHNDLIWYISHKLDIGRGSIMLEQSSKKTSHKASSILTQNIIDIVSFLKLNKTKESL